jgi:predicted permease
MLAIGIGATTAVFSIVEGVLLRPLPFPDAGRLVALGDLLEGVGWEPGVTAPETRDYAHNTHSFTSLGAYQGITFELSGLAEPAVVNATRISSDAFRALDVAPLLGRVFTQQEDDEHEQVAVLSCSLWKSRFGGNGQIVGKKILLDRRPYVIVGLMPCGFEFPLVPGHSSRSDLWVPLSLSPGELTTGVATWNFQMVGRLKPGITAAEALSDAGRVAQESMRNYPAYMHRIRIHPLVVSLQEAAVAHARPLIRMLFLVVAVVLLIACANVAGLLLVRSIRRRREIAVRLALGARASALLQQAILESLALSAAGGLALAAGTVRAGVSLLPETMPRISEIGLDWPVVGFALALAIGTGVLCGLAPAFSAIRTGVNEALKEGGRTGALSGGHVWLRSALVVAEIGIAVVLVTTAGLLLRSFEKMREADLGIRPDHALTAAYSLPRTRYATQSAVDAFADNLLGSLRRLPGVQSAGITSLLPAGADDNDVSMTFEGYTPPHGAGLSMVTPSAVLGDAFGALGIRLLRGRLFADGDDANSPLVVVVNRKLAEHYWPGQDPINKRLHRGSSQTRNPWLTVVGEVNDVKMGPPDGRTAEQIYQPVKQWTASRPFAAAAELNGSAGYIVLRAVTQPEQMQNALQATVRRIDAQLPLYQMQTIEHAISVSEAPRRFHTVLVTLFAIIAALLGGLGIYSVIAFSVALRRQEIAIRVALGAQRQQIRNLVLVSGVRLAALGCFLGLLGAIGASRLLRSFLFDVSPLDMGVLTFSAGALLLLALASSAIPAGRAARTEPAMVLRAE